MNSPEPIAAKNPNRDKDSSEENLADDSRLAKPSHDGIANEPMHGTPAIDSASGVNPLDSSLVKQTKNEIRLLTSEIAQLAYSDISEGEFFGGFLSRLTMAIGATGSAVWKCSYKTSELHLASGFNLPAELVNDQQPTSSHETILRSVIQEQHATIVPPRGVHVTADRPKNPLDDSLILVPLKIKDHVEYLIEVVQRPSGGPAAQRGYLRFAAQMTDLAGDYLRQRKLRSLENSQDTADQIVYALTRLATASSQKESTQRAADDLRRICNAEHAIVLSRKRHFQVAAISDTQGFDTRSEMILSLNRLITQLDRALREQRHRQEQIDGQPKLANSIDSGDTPPILLDASNRRSDDDAATGTITDTNHSQTADATNLQSQAIAPLQSQIDALCETTGCRRLVAFPLGQLDWHYVVLTYRSTAEDFDEQLSLSPAMRSHLLIAVGALLNADRRPHSRRLLKSSLSPRHAPPQRRRALLKKAAILAATFGIICLPVPQNISAPATLFPDTKQSYRAPMQATIDKVLVNEGEKVVAGQALLLLRQPELESQVLRLQSQRERSEETIAETRERLGKSDRLDSSQRSELELRLQSAEFELEATNQELKVRQSERDSLTIHARADGMVSSWGFKNELTDRPVDPDDLLLTTFSPDDDWYFEVSVPEHRIWIVEQQVLHSDSHPSKKVPVRFTLNGAPDRLVVGELTQLASQAVNSPSASTAVGENRAIKARVKVNAQDLPLLKDGAVARASIQCGRVTLGWLVVRDAYWFVQSRIRMLW